MTSLRRRASPVVILLGILLGSLLLATRCSPLRVSGTGLVITGEADDNFFWSEIADPPLLHSPHAVLVLDISGSMRRYDPDHWQRIAAEEFFHTFSSLVAGFVDEGEVARIAVVLYATVARVVDWGGGESSELWLEADLTQSSRFERMLAAHLGQEGVENRRGWDTDHLAAIETVKALSQGLPSPPLVLFMTDGIPDPHPAFAANTRERFLGPGSGLQPGSLNTVRAESEAEMLTIAADGPRLEIFTRDARGGGLERHRMTERELEDYRRVAATVRQEFLSRSFPMSNGELRCPLWEALILGDDARGREYLVEEILEDDSSCRNSWDGAGRLSWMDNPSDLVPRFVSSLAPWFGLQEVRWDEGSRSVSLSPPVGAAAIILETENPVDFLDLAGERGEISLSGRGRMWAGVLPGSGEWQLTDSATGRVSGLLLIRPRYIWSLLSPREMPVAPGGRVEGELVLGLFSIESRSFVSPFERFSSLPNEITAHAASEGSRATIPIPLRVDSIGTARTPPGYRGDVDMLPVTSSDLEWTAVVEKDALNTAVLDATGVHLESRFRLVPSTEVSIVTGSGAKAGLNFRNVPAEARPVRTWLSRWLGTAP